MRTLLHCIYFKHTGNGMGFSIGTIEFPLLLVLKQPTFFPLLLTDHHFLFLFLF